MIDIDSEPINDRWTQCMRPPKKDKVTDVKKAWTDEARRAALEVKKKKDNEGE